MSTEQTFSAREDFDGAPLSGLALPLDPARFFSIGRRLVEELSALHEAGLVHNLLCPETVLVGEGDEIRLLRSERVARSGEKTAYDAELDAAYLPFSSPERTGRTAHAPDIRSDLYSLGAVFYLLLTGHPPFETTDPVALVHSHLATRPVSPSARRRGVSPALGAVVLKLLEKEPGERYQTLFGVLSDLRRLEAESGAGGQSAAPFTPGQEDRRARFCLPSRLIGRSEEQSALRERQELVRAGGAASWLVCGDPGSGKSALVEEAGRSFREEGGVFLEGRFSDLTASPHEALFGALRGFFRGIEERDPEAAARFRRFGRSKRAGSVAVLAELLPELRPLLGELPALDELHPGEREQRFRLAITDLLTEMVAGGKPIFLFLDDLDRADSTSRSLVGYLATAGSVPGVLLVGALRDRGAREGGAGGDALAEIGATRVSGLGLLEVAAYLTEAFGLTDSLSAGSEELSDLDALAALVLQKTGGNPFFVRELLTRLEARGGFSFRLREGRWRWDLGLVRGEIIAQGLADLLGARVAGLGPEARGALGAAAAIGDRFSVKLLGVALDTPVEALQERLAEAESAGVVAPVGGEEGLYTFAHPALRRAAYDGVSASERSRAHWRLGEHHQREVEGGDEAALFLAVDHLLLGETHIAQAERAAFLSLARRAAERARGAGAHEAALRYLEAALGDHGPSSWETRYEETFALHLALLEASYLANQHDRAERWLSLLLSRTKSPVDRARVHILRIHIHSFRGEYRECVEVMRVAMAELGFSVPKSAQLGLTVELGRALWSERRVDLTRLQDRPMTGQGKAEAAQAVLFAVAPAAFILDKMLSALLGLRMFNIAVKHGFNAHGVYGASFLALVYTAVFGNLEKGHAIATALIGGRHHFPADPAYHGRYLLGFGTVLLWSKSTYEEILPHILEGHAQSRRASDVVYIGFYTGVLLQTYLYMGRSTRELEEHLAAHALIARRLRFREADLEIQTVGRFLRHLHEDGAREGLSLAEGEFEVGEPLTDVLERGFFHINYLLLALIHGDGEIARRCLAVLDGLKEFTTGSFHRPEYLTYASLCLGAAPADESGPALRRLRKIARELRGMAEIGAAAHGHRSLIAELSIAVLEDRFKESCLLFQQAIDACRERRFLHLAGIVAERAADFYERNKLPVQKAEYAGMARALFEEYGARGKVSALDRRFAGAAAASGGGPVSRRAGASLDAESLMKASRAIFDTIEMESVSMRLVELAMESAGATRGHLFVRGDDAELHLAAEGRVTGGEIHVAAVPEGGLNTIAPESCPVEIARLVLSSGAPIVASDATEDRALFETSYVKTRGTRSLLGVSIASRGGAEAVLILENELTSGAFTPERMAIEVLVSLAAISLATHVLVCRRSGRWRWSDRRRAGSWR
ncbi:MAG: AAA family ATPase [Polyangiaceae bacterium]